MALSLVFKCELNVFNFKQIFGFLKSPGKYKFLIRINKINKKKYIGNELLESCVFSGNKVGVENLLKTNDM